MKMPGVVAGQPGPPLAGAANAIVSYDNLYDNLGSISGGVDPLTGWIDVYGRVLSPPLFDSFSVGPAGFNLLDVQLLLKRDPGNSTGNFSVYLYSFDSSTPLPLPPGTRLTTIGTLSDNALPSTLAVVDFPLAKPYTLAANTRYWLVLNSTDNSTANWSWSMDQAVGVAGEYFGHGSWVYENIEGPYQMRLSGTSLIPLPGTLVLLGSGLAGLGLWPGQKTL